MMTSDYKLNVGSYGWLYQSWQNTFYPDDLPEEWQLAYYANEYSVLMIPWDIIEGNIELLKQGLEDSDDSCRFIIEIPVYDINSRASDEVINDLEDMLHKITFIDARCLGLVLVLKYTEVVNLSNEGIALITKLIESCQAIKLTCLDLQTESATEIVISSLPMQFQEFLNHSGIELCRYNQSRLALSELTNSKLHITFCDISNLEPIKMREIVENSLIGECEYSTNVLIFRTPVPSHEQMNSASIICDLL